MAKQCRAVLVLALASTIAVQAAPVPRDAGRGNPDEIKKRVYRCWKEVRRENADGVIDKPANLLGYEYSPDGCFSWSLQGELSGGKGDSIGVRVDPTKDPMRIDFLVTINMKTRVTPGIFRFEEDKLVVVTATKGGYQPLREDGDYPNRPTSFTTTKENKYEKNVLVECLKYDQD